MSWQDIVRIDAPTEHSLSGTGEKTFLTEMSVCEEDRTKQNNLMKSYRKRPPSVLLLESQNIISEETICKKTKSLMNSKDMFKMIVTVPAKHTKLGFEMLKKNIRINTFLLS